jgi:hypothetical protein
MTFLTSIAVIGAGTLLFAGSAAAVEPAPTPTPSPAPGAVHVLTEQEVQEILLHPSDFDHPFTAEPGPAAGIAPTTCLDRLDFLPQGVTSGSRTLADDFYTVVISGVSSHESAQQAGGVLTAAKFVASGCPELDIEDMTLSVEISDGPAVGSDEQFMLTLVAGDDEQVPLKAELLYERVGNNVGYVGVLSADEPAPVDMTAVAQRFHDKLSAASKGEPIPLTAEQAARRLALGETYQGTRSTVTVSQPSPYTPADSTDLGDGYHLTVTATVENQGTEVMPAIMISSTATCDGVEAARIIDPEAGLTDSPPSDIAPEQTVSWSLAYTVPAAGCELDVVMTYAMFDDIHFTGKA